jgi:hypothetical protein
MEKQTQNWARTLGQAALGVAMIASTYVAASSWVAVKTREVHTIDVTGSAKKRIVSDLIKWDAYLSTEDMDRKLAYQSLASHIQKTKSYLLSQGISEEEISISAVNTTERYETEYTSSGETQTSKEVFKGYTTSQTISVTSLKVSTVERVSREVTQLLEQGVPINSSSPAYFYTKLGELKIEMLAEASKDARTRAERILNSAGDAQLGPLIDADMGIININPANSTETSWSGNNDTSALEKDILTIVHCNFEIK